MERNIRAINSILRVGDLVNEAGAEHNTPARIIEVIERHGMIYYRIHFKYRAILQKVVLPDYRLNKYEGVANV